MSKEILESDITKIVNISKEFGANKVLLFGSCLENKETANDIDIAVSGIKPVDFFNYYGKISAAINNEVDIVDLDEIREHLRRRLLSKGMVLYEG